MIKGKQDNDGTNCIGLVYAKNEIELFWPTDRVRFVTKTRYGNEVIEWIGAIYIENNIELLWPIISGIVCDENQTWQLCD